MIEWRDYRDGDLDAMYALDVVCFEKPFRFTRAAMRQFAEDRRARVVIADDGGSLVGFCIMHIEEEVGYVVTLDVAPERRRQGVAVALMVGGEEEARVAGCGVMSLHVYVGNDAAIRFYERIGYERLRKARGFYGVGVDAWVYRKGL